ncbi:hypothetical protein [Planctomicrobium piriforme]|uniref:DUF4398 domain-containing protein n=1 Tax=Planctomicrobium piriforme TaxID=1576369 RepID=A0A1I3AU96_9PLAN|nr:hypothetical protein [Planctomicrobium piriforme]SFH53583.1 hypothetical protein SAMN05421753_10161 [Planctomicrobium piriforme]
MKLFYLGLAGSLACLTATFVSAEDRNPSLKLAESLRMQAMRLLDQADAIAARETGVKTAEPKGAPHPLVQVRHLREAAENLAAAGFEREADELRTRATALEREAQRRHGGEVPQQVIEELTALRRSVEELRSEVAVLRRALTRFETDVEPTPAAKPEPLPRGLVRPRIPFSQLDEPVTRPVDPRTKKNAKDPEPTPAEKVPDEFEFEYELVPIPASGSTPVPEAYNSGNTNSDPEMSKVK